MKRSMLVLVSLLAAFVAVPACSDDDDQPACRGLEAGDDCVEADGDPGICRFDRSDNVLECESGGRSGNETACLDLSNGDACTQPDGDAGICRPDDSSQVLECED